MSLWRFIFNRLRYHWQVFSTLLFGIIFSITLLSSGPLIVNTVLDLSLPYKLRTSEPLDGNLHLIAYEHFSKEDYYEYDNTIRQKLSLHLGKFLSNSINGANSGYSYPWIDGLLARDHRVSLGFYRDLEKNTKLIEGEWPIQNSQDNNLIRVVISSSFSNDYQLNIGDKIPLSLNPNESEPSIWFYISGIISQSDPRDIYWFGKLDPLNNKAEGRWVSSYSGFVMEDDFFDLNDRYFRNARSEFYWNVIVDPDQVTFEQIYPFTSGLNGLRSVLKNITPTVSVSTNIPNVLGSFLSRSRIVKTTLYFLIGEVFLLGISYVTLISTLFSEYFSAEYSNLSSRGSSPKNIIKIQLFEALIVSGVALIFGILTAILLVSLIVNIGPLSDVSQSIWSLRFPITAFVAALLGVLICIFSLLLPVNSALKHSIVTHSRNVSRSDRSPFWKRIYLDLVLLFVGILLLWRYYAFGGISAAQQGGSIDWLLLSTPLIILTGAAALVNRIFPIMVKGLALLFARGKSFSTTLALYFISRNPNKLPRLIFLLMLCMMLGVFTSGLNATLDANEYERALYAIGSPFRIEIDQPVSGTNLNLTNKDEVESFVYRSQGTMNIRAYRTVPSFELLAIDPYTLIEVTKFRSDYASNPMGQVLGNLITDIQDHDYPAINLMGEPIAIGIWILNDTLNYSDNDLLDLISLRCKIQTATGETFLVSLRPSSFDGFSQFEILNNTIERQWQYFEGSIMPLSKEKYPLSLHSIWFRSRSTSYRYERISILIDDLSLRFQNSDVAIAEDFEDVTNIWSVNDNQASVFFTRRKSAHSGTGSLNLEIPTFQTRFGGIGLSIAGTSTLISIPVLASQEFLSVTELDIGDKFIGNVDSIRVPLVIADAIRYFPTLFDQPGQGFLVLPGKPLINYLNQETIKPHNMNEIWVNPKDTDLINSIAELNSDFVTVRSIEEERRLIKADAFTLGLRSVTLISFWISVILSVVGISSNFYINARSRENQFGILRSLGMSIRQLYAMLIFEQVLIILIGLIMGLILGMIVNMIILPGLPISLSEKPPVPPFLPHMNWTSMLTLFVIMTASFILSIGISTIFLWKTEVHKVMRIGIE